MPGLEFNVLCSSAIVTRDREQAARQIVEDWKFAAEYTVEQVLESPAALIGEVEQIVEKLHQNRERFGFSYFVVGEEALEGFAPVVQRLAGR